MNSADREYVNSADREDVNFADKEDVNCVDREDVSCADKAEELGITPPNSSFPLLLLAAACGRISGVYIGILIRQKTDPLTP